MNEPIQNSAPAAPQVSVVIPAYNAGPFVAGALRSVLRQTWRSFEVVVVDDGSEDDTAAVVSSFGERVRLLRQDNAGQSAARNRGIAAARGRWVAFLDADDLWHPEILRRQVEAFRADPEVGLVYTNCWNTDGESLLPLQRGAQRVAYSGWVFRRLLRENFVMTCTVMVRREVLERVGGFDEELRVSEDYDLWLRLARECAFTFVDRPLAFYRVRTGSTFGDLEQRLRARRRILDKLRTTTSEEDLGPRGTEEFSFQFEYHLGHRYLQGGQRRQARQLFQQAGRHGIERGRVWASLLSTWVPGPLMERLRGARLALLPRHECLEVLRARRGWNHGEAA